MLYLTSPIYLYQNDWGPLAAKRIVYVTKDGLQISWVSEMDDGIELALEQRRGGLEREVGR